MTETPLPLIARDAHIALGGTTTHDPKRGWLVKLTHQRKASPVGLTFHERRKDDPLPLGAPQQLDTSTQDALDSLIAFGDTHMDATAAAADALLDHCQQHPSRGLLCAQHGLPQWHDGQFFGCDDSDTLAVEDVLRMVNSWRALIDLATNAARRRIPLRPQQIEDLLQWPVIDPVFWRNVAAKDMAKSGGISVNTQKAIVTEYVEQLQRQTRVTIGYRWLPQYGLRLAMNIETANSDLGLYVAALVSTVLDAVNVSGVARFVTCEHCGEPFQPRNTRQRYCAAPDCRREHRRVNKARARAATKERTDQ